MIKCFEQELRGIIISEVKQAKFFSVMADECSDVANKEQLAIVIRYVNEDDEICEDFVEFVEFENRITGLELAEKIKSALQDKYGLDMINLRGQCYDGAGNMSGVRNGLAARVTHVVKSCDITEVRNMIDKATEVAIFFNYSPQRQRAFEEQIEIYCKENEQDTVEDKDEKRKRKKKLKMLCKTRWVERHDAYNTFTELYTPLVNTLTYIAQHSSEFTSDTVKKASSFLDGITEFQFIATLIIAKHILSTTQILSKSLQYRNAQDIVRRWNHVKITHKRVKEIRQDIDKHHATWFSESTVMAEKVGEEPRIPRRCARQIQRNNVPATTPSGYYKLAISIPMLDHLESEINSRFTELQSTAAKGMSIVPATLCVTTTAASVKELDKNIDRLVTNYMADLEDDRDLLKEEIHQWKIEWQDAAEKGRPNTAASALNSLQYNSGFSSVRNYQHISRNFIKSSLNLSVFGKI